MRPHWLTPLVLLVACAGSPAPDVGKLTTPVVRQAQQQEEAPQGSPAPAEATLRKLAADAASLQDMAGLSPAILLPGTAVNDDIVASAGSLAIRKSHVFDRYLDSDPTRARKLVDELVLDALVAQEAHKHGISVDPLKVRAMADREERQLADQVQKDLAGKVSLAQYVERQLSMSLDEYRRWRVLTLGRKFYREYVIRYLGLLQDRVQVRYLVTSDKSIVEEARKRALAGADFASLCTRWSEDDLRLDGGLLPPFAQGFQHPIAKAAFALEPGQVSEPLAYERDGAVKWFLVYCLKRLPGRQVAFAATRAEIDLAIEAQPLSEFEINAYYVQARSTAEKLPSVESRR